MSAFLESAAEVRGLMASAPMIRAVNYHNTAGERAAEFDAQFAHCRKHFSSVTEDDLDRYLQSGQWHKEKPGLLLAFYEGYRNNFDVVLPLLEKHGLTGWFFIITGFVDCPVEQQLDFVEPHGIGMSTREYADGRYAMSWDEIRELDRLHVVASHAHSHWLIAPMSAEDQRREVIGSQERFRDELGHPVSTFVSRGGPAYGDHAPTDRLIEEAGYRFVVSGYRIQRVAD